MNQAIEDFIRSRRIALVGASLNPKKFGHVAFRELARRGYEMVPVHLTASRVAGVRSYQSLQAVEGTLDEYRKKPALDYCWLARHERRSFAERRRCLSNQ